MNRTLLPPPGTTHVLRERVDERGIPIPSWWTDDENDATIDANTLFALQLKSPRRR